MPIPSMPKIIPGPAARRYKKLEIPWKRIFLSIFLLLLFFAAIYLLFFSSTFSIKEIEIGHIAQAEKEKIQNLAEEEALGKNIFIWQKSTLEKKITTQYPLILKIVIFKGLPHTLRIVIQETSPQLNWLSQDKSYLIDEKGRIIKEGKNNKLITIIDRKNLGVKQGDKILPVSFMDFIDDFNQQAEKIGIKIEYFEIYESLFDLWAKIKDGKKMIITPLRKPEEMLEQYQKSVALFTPSEYVDLRFPQRVFVK